MKSKLKITSIYCFLITFLCSCYSFTGASISGKTINVRPFENKAYNVVPTLATALNNKVRNKIISQTGLAPVNSDEADYDMQANITGYNVSISGVENSAVASTNRLTITLEVNFTNRIDSKQNFKQSFSRFADFGANEPLQVAETRLIDDIGAQLAEDIFNKAFVNW